jgi:hypothetical protein
MCGSAIALITTTTTTTVVAGGKEPGTAAGLAGPSRAASVSRTATVHGTGIEKALRGRPRAAFFCSRLMSGENFLYDGQIDYQSRPWNRACLLTFPRTQTAIFPKASKSGLRPKMSAEFEYTIKLFCAANWIGLFLRASCLIFTQADSRFPHPYSDGSWDGVRRGN